jgi:hypothetical protein
LAKVPHEHAREMSTSFSHARLGHLGAARTRG